MMSSLKIRLEQAVELLRESSCSIAFTGAGVSTESGLSDFRSPGGVWEKYRTVTYQDFLASSKDRVEYWAMHRELNRDLLRARPNPGHQALANMERLGRLQGIITQNIDGLHQLAGNARVIELHGTNRTAHCLDCNRAWDIEVIQRRLEDGAPEVICDFCSGLVKPSTVSFGQPMPQRALTKAFAWASRCNLMIMIGSSLEVHPAATVPVTAWQEGAKLIFINRTPTPYDEMATLRFPEGAGEILPLLIKELDLPDPL